MDDDTIQLKPSTTIILMPNTDAGRISSSFRMAHNSMALYAVTDLSKCKFNRVLLASASLGHPLKQLAIVISLLKMSFFELSKNVIFKP